jgi:hypothetical protein
MSFFGDTARSGNNLPGVGLTMRVVMDGGVLV